MPTLYEALLINTTQIGRSQVVRPDAQEKKARESKRDSMAEPHEAAAWVPPSGMYLQQTMFWDALGSSGHRISGH